MSHNSGRRRRVAAKKAPPKSASLRIEAGIKELADWRGATLARVDARSTRMRSRRWSAPRWP